MSWGTMKTRDTNFAQETAKVKMPANMDSCDVMFNLAIDVSLRIYHPELPDNLFMKLKKVNNMDLSPTLIFECLLYTDKKNLVGLTQRSMRTITYICLFFFHQISRIVRRHIGCFACTSLNTLTQWRSNDYRKQKNKFLICQKREMHPKWTVLFSLNNLGYSTVTVVSFWK